MRKRVGSRPATAGLRQTVGSGRLVRRVPVRHPGMTLIELLIAISIVAILATLLLGVAAKATQTAREARTKQLVSRIHTLVIEHYESYRFRRVELKANSVDNIGVSGVPDWLELQIPASSGINTSLFSSNTPGQWLAAGRLAGVRELMKMEMPDRWSDIVGNTLLPASDTAIAPSSLSPLNRYAYLRKVPSLSSLYLRRYNEITAPTHINTETGARNTAGDLRANQNAECLYLVVMNATGDGEARSLFKESDIGDVDGDGAPEFIDAWGKPIGWLRWAPGYDSDLQTSFASLKRVYDRPITGVKGKFKEEGVTEALTEDHDPFDLFQADRFDSTGLNTTDMTGARGWRLIPLVFSAGQDEELGLILDEAYTALVDPYPVNPRLGGFSDPDKATDNITNHHITAK